MADVIENDNSRVPKRPELGSGFTVVAQKARREMLIRQGTWDLDENRGFPWIRWLQTSPPPLEEMQQVIPFRVVENVPGLAEFNNFDLEFDNTTGVITSTGGELVGTDDVPGVAEINLTHDVTEDVFHPLITLVIRDMV